MSWKRKYFNFHFLFCHPHWNASSSNISSSIQDYFTLFPSARSFLSDYFVGCRFREGSKLFWRWAKSDWLGCKVDLMRKKRDMNRSSRNENGVGFVPAFSVNERKIMTNETENETLFATRTSKNFIRMSSFWRQLRTFTCKKLICRISVNFHFQWKVIHWLGAHLDVRCTCTQWAIQSNGNSMRINWFLSSVF